MSSANEERLLACLDKMQVPLAVLTSVYMYSGAVACWLADDTMDLPCRVTGTVVGNAD